MTRNSTATTRTTSSTTKRLTRSRRAAALLAVAAMLLPPAALLPAARVLAATPEFVADVERQQMWRRGQQAIEAQQWAEADKWFEELDRRTPDDARVLTQRAYVRRHLGDLTQARALYRRALLIDPDNLDALEYDGEAALLADDALAAIDHLRSLRRLCGERCEQYKDLREALDAWKKTATSSPGTR